MPPPPQTTAGGSTVDKMLMGAAMGTGVGLSIGAIFGGFSILTNGPGPRGTMATLSQYMLSSAATFGFFMSIGSVIRTESPYDLPLPREKMENLRWRSPIASAWRSGSRMEVEVRSEPLAARTP